MSRIILGFLGVGLLLMFAVAACGNADSDGDPVIDPPVENPPILTGGTIANHLAVAAFDNLPADSRADVSALRIYYGHTSHGSQLMTGLQMLAREDPSFVKPDVHEELSDLGQRGDLTWESTTRAWLQTHAADTDVVIWSWCGGATDNTPAGIDIYLDAMNQLEADYPDIVFVYMTGHLDGTGVDGTLYANNNQIRDYCDEHDKWLFDFADIESYDPDGGYYPDGSDAAEWCYEWCATHECPSCIGCAHSHCFNCYLKGKAFWWLLARVAADAS